MPPKQQNQQSDLLTNNEVLPLEDRIKNLVEVLEELGNLKFQFLFELNGVTVTTKSLATQHATTVTFNNGGLQDVYKWLKEAIKTKFEAQINSSLDELKSLQDEHKAKLQVKRAQLIEHKKKKRLSEVFAIEVTSNVSDAVLDSTKQ